MKDKEKQICKHYNEEVCSKLDCKKDCKYYGKANCKTCIHEDICQLRTYSYCEKEVKEKGCEHYQPKLPEDSVVLSMTEYQDLKERANKKIDGLELKIGGVGGWFPISFIQSAIERDLDHDRIVLSREEYELWNILKKTWASDDKEVSAEDMLETLKNAKELGSKETAEKFMVLRGYITKQFHKYHEQRDIAESEYKKCKEKMGKAVLNNDWHRCDAIMFILEDIATRFEELAKQFGVEIKE